MVHQGAGHKLADNATSHAVAEGCFRYATSCCRLPLQSQETPCSCGHWTHRCSLIWRRLCEDTQGGRWLRLTVGPVVQLICVTDGGDDVTSIPTLIFTLKGAASLRLDLRVSWLQSGHTVRTKV